VDGLVATLLAELDAGGRLESSDVIVVGDHGFVEVANGGSSHVYVTGGRGSVERTREVLAAASGVREQDPTQGDLVLHAAEGWFFTRHATPELAAAALPYHGTHGHRPDDPRLHAGFIAAGPSIVPGARVAVLDQLDVAPMAAAMLGLRLPTAERAPSPLILRGS
jgi:arylsulfatase A-like enzyme